MMKRYEMRYLLAALILLFGCVSTNPGPGYKLEKAGYGVIASKMNALDSMHYCKFIFENKDTGRKKEHIVNRVTAEGGGPLIVNEMEAGHWELVRFDIFEGIGERRIFYRIDDDLRIAFEIKEGEVNLFPIINIEYECHTPAIRLAGMRSSCSDFRFTLSGNEAEIEKEVKDKYINLADMKFNLAIKDKEISNGYTKTGIFR